MNDNLNNGHQAIIIAARNTSSAFEAALEAVANMRHAETWAEREQRLAEGRSSPTGWPVHRLHEDDGITIPERRALAVLPPDVAQSRLHTFIRAGMDFDDDADKLISLEKLAVVSAVVLSVGYFFLMAQGGL